MNYPCAKFGVLVSAVLALSYRETDTHTVTDVAHCYRARRVSNYPTLSYMKECLSQRTGSAAERVVHNSLS